MKITFLVLLGFTFLGLGACIASRNDGFDYGHKVVRCTERGDC